MSGFRSFVNDIAYPELTLKYTETLKGNLQNSFAVIQYVHV
jgi:hypothetical protein